MSKYRVGLKDTISFFVTVEADDADEAIDKALDEVPTDVCGQCGGWGRGYSMEIDGEWSESNDPSDTVREVDAE